jgi:hypothetical protein
MKIVVRLSSVRGKFTKVAISLTGGLVTQLERIYALI